MILFLFWNCGTGAQLLQNWPESKRITFSFVCIQCTCIGHSGSSSCSGCWPATKSGVFGDKNSRLVKIDWGFLNLEFVKSKKLNNVSYYESRIRLLDFPKLLTGIWDSLNANLMLTKLSFWFSAVELLIWNTETMDISLIVVSNIK